MTNKYDLSKEIERDKIYRVTKNLIHVREIKD